MATWTTDDQPDEKCPKCGAQYKVTVTQYPVKERDSFHCTSGYEMRTWKDTRSWLHLDKGSLAGRVSASI